MDDTAPAPVTKPFMLHPNLSDEVNQNIVQSEIEGGHGVFPRPEAVRECLDWLDKYLGPVRH